MLFRLSTEVLRRFFSTYLYFLFRNKPIFLSKKWPGYIISEISMTPYSFSLFFPSNTELNLLQVVETICFSGIMMNHSFSFLSNLHLEAHKEFAEIFEEHHHKFIAPEKPISTTELSCFFKNLTKYQKSPVERVFFALTSTAPKELINYSEKIQYTCNLFFNHPKNSEIPSFCEKYYTGNSKTFNDPFKFSENLQFNLTGNFFPQKKIKNLLSDYEVFSKKYFTIPHEPQEILLKTSTAIGNFSRGFLTTFIFQLLIRTLNSFFITLFSLSPVASEMKKFEKLFSLLASLGCTLVTITWCLAAGSDYLWLLTNLSFWEMMFQSFLTNSNTLTRNFFLSVLPFVISEYFVDPEQFDPLSICSLAVGSFLGKFLLDKVYDNTAKILTNFWHTKSSATEVLTTAKKFN